MSANIASNIDLSELLNPNPDFNPFTTATAKISIMFIIVCWVAYIMRIWIRYKFLKVFMADDYFMAAALVRFL